MEKKIKILLVEDEVVAAMFLKMELEKEGYIVCKHVTTGENAIISAEADKPDVILMDIFLAGKINGIDAAKEIKEKTDIPIIIFLTGFEDSGLKEKAMKLDPLAYIIKPVVLTELKDIINKKFL
jgi:CheY-like chemotaxis protein